MAFVLFLLALGLATALFVCAFLYIAMFKTKDLIGHRFALVPAAITFGMFGYLGLRMAPCAILGADPGWNSCNAGESVVYATFVTALAFSGALGVIWSVWQFWNSEVRGNG